MTCSHNTKTPYIIEYKNTSNTVLIIEYRAEAYLSNSHEGTKQTYDMVPTCMRSPFLDLRVKLTLCFPFETTSRIFRSDIPSNLKKSTPETPQKENMGNNPLLSYRCKGELIRMISTCFCPQFHDHKPPP